MSEEHEKRVKEMMSVASQQNWDMKPMTLAQEISKFLDSIKDEGTCIDSGGGNGDADLWVKIGGIEYYINVRKSNAQQAKEAKS